MDLNAETGINQSTSAMLLLAGMVAAIVSVLGFEHIGGYIPCKLCLEQRQPYYAGIPIVGLAALSAVRVWPACVTRGLLAIGGLLMVYTAVLGFYHAGVEWAWWEGPADCGTGGGGALTDAGDLLSQMVTSKSPVCDEAAGRFLGLSFAGWNVVVAIILAGIGFKGAFGRSR